MAQVSSKRRDLRYSPDKTISLYLQDFCSSHNLDWSSLSSLNKRKLYTLLLQKCKCCDLSYDRGPVVPFKDSITPKAVFIGRNPGKGDDINNSLFSTDVSGGKVFAKYLKELDLQRGEVYVSNVVMCRTSRNSPPTSRQTSMCSGWKLLEDSFITYPRYIFLMGNDALRLFYGQSYPAVQRIYGDLYLSSFQGRDTLFIPVQHPGFIVRNPDELENTMLLLRSVYSIMSKPSAYGLGW